MKRNLKKLAACVLSVALLLTAAACGGGPDSNEEKNGSGEGNTLRILVWAGGYGDQWAKDLVEGFRKKYPDMKVELESNPLRDKISVQFEANPKDNRYDILISDCEATNIAYTDYKIQGVEHAFAELTDLYDTIPEGETRSVREKLFDGADTYYTQYNEGNYIATALATVSGFIYNKEIFKDCGLTHEPRTSDELLEYCEIFKKNGYVPMIFGGDTDYYSPTIYDWWIQYQGWDGYKDYFSGQAADKFGEKHYSASIFDQKGKLYAMETFEKLVGAESHNTDSKVTSYLFMDAQRRFMSKDSETGKYKYAMMVNGGWLENEMKNFYQVGSVPLAFMTTPLLSDVVYEDVNKSKEQQTPVCDEAVLRACVDYVEGVTSEKPAGVSDEFLSRVKDGVFRCNTALGFGAVIPSTSPNIAAAKKFLTYLYSDEGAKIVAESGCGGYVPVDYDYSSLEGYDEMTEVQKGAAACFSEDYAKNYLMRSHPIVYRGGLVPIARTSLYAAFCSDNPADRRTAQDLFDDLKGYYTSGNAWSNLLTLSGISNE